jgi:hypothetical protein
MLSVSVVACFAGQFLLCFPPPFSPAALRRSKVCLLAKQAFADVIASTSAKACLAIASTSAKQAFADVLAMAFCSPASISGLPVTAAGSMLLASRFAYPVRIPSDPFGSSLQTSLVSE